MTDKAKQADSFLNKPLLQQAAHAGKDDTMQAAIINEARPNNTKVLGLPSMTHKNGKMTYEVYLHFSKTATETISDKMLRLIRNDISNSNDIR